MIEQFIAGTIIGFTICAAISKYTLGKIIDEQQHTIKILENNRCLNFTDANATVYVNRECTGIVSTKNVVQISEINGMYKISSSVPGKNKIIETYFVDKKDVKTIAIVCN